MMPRAYITNQIMLVFIMFSYLYCIQTHDTKYIDALPTKVKSSHVRLYFACIKKCVDLILL